MKRKSFGKLAIVAILATLMLLGLCVCSKKADTSAATTTTTASTTTTTTTTTVATPATTASPATTTTTTTTVVEEKPVVEEVKVEEVKAEEPVVETVVVEPVVEEVAVVVPEYSTVFSYNGITSSIDAYSDHAVISIPEGVTAEDITAIAKLLVSAYPESSAVTYEIKDSDLCLYYPEQALSYVKAAVSTLSSDAMWLIDILFAEDEAVAEETEEDENLLFTTSFDSDGITSFIAVYADHAYLTIPGGVTSEDIAAAAAALVEAYPEYANQCTYAIEDGILTLTYPELSAEELVAYCDYLYGEAVAYIDSLIETVVEVVEEQIAATTFDILDDGTIVATYDYNGIKASVVMSDTETVITYPSQYVTKDDILGYINAMVAAVPSLAENVYYAFEGDDTVIFYYPAEYMGGTYYKLETLAAADENVTAYIDAQLAEVVVAEVPVETTASTEPAAPAPVVAEPVAVAPVEPVAPTPIAAKTSFVQSYSVASAFEAGYNLNGKSLALGGSLRAEAALCDKLAFGLKVGYDFKLNTLPVALYGKYTFAEFGNAKLYGTLGLGIDVSTKGKGVGFGAEGTLGLEYAFTYNLSAFAEASVKYSTLNKVSFGGAVGGKITF